MKKRALSNIYLCGFMGSGKSTVDAVGMAGPLLTTCSSASSAVFSTSRTHA